MPSPDVAALQLLVPGAEVLLDAVRGLPGVGLLEPAHVSLGYPWRPAADVDEELLVAAAAQVPPFAVRFPVATSFSPDGRGRVLVHVAPEEDAPFRRLAGLVGADLRQPHLSVARVASGPDRQERVDDVLSRVAALLPLSARVDLLELTVQRAGQWQPGTRWRLGDGTRA